MEKGPEIAGRTVIRLLVSSKNIFHGNGNRRRFLAGCPNEGSCGGEGISSAIRLAYPWRTRHTFGPRPRRTAPNTHTDSGGPASQGQAAVPGTRPGRSRYAYVPSIAAIQRSDWLTPQKERPVPIGMRQTQHGRGPVDDASDQLPLLVFLIRRVAAVELRLLHSLAVHEPAEAIFRARRPSPR